MHVWTRWGGALIAVAGLAGQVTAQAAPVQAPDLRMLSLTSLKAGRSVRVGGPGFGTITGSFAGVRDGSLWLGAEPTGRNVPIAGIDSLWVGRGHGTTGAIVGLLIGTIVGVAALSGKKCEFGDDACVTGGTLEFTGIVLGGALLGAIMGDQAKSWDLRYP